MADPSIQQVLAQMRTLASQAQRTPSNEAAATATGTASSSQGFQGMLTDALRSVNDLQQTASQKSDTFLRGGNVSLAEAMVAGQKSRVAFTAVKETRTQLLDAYRQISRMQV
ncbi:Flagellar hook-basal body complex protein FliE [wastewater metagenome]|uniref:Flagellar hook-basal body complex protein FliE n=2 Tax=unclassified sequences TaxID=12908 RepID=A0A5B8R4V1_9ZZZZ|nr:MULTISPECIES: flagellar hook-basal body complex protein FliE [Arhodomonas]MCS4502798.1 flagellar hook-basal body complex protein FliE [Arhodomonas aquaeolei]QEA03719.1 flagellar hook-basal body complex protein FliE [uncultured organism]